MDRTMKIIQKNLIVLIAGMMSWGGAVWAALPPYFTSVEQIKTILDSTEVQNYLGSASPIISLAVVMGKPEAEAKNGYQSYELKTIHRGEPCTITLSLTDVNPSGKLGAPLIQDVKIIESTCPKG